jgi:hypothetical protein
MRSVELKAAVDIFLMLKKRLIKFHIVWMLKGAQLLPMGVPRDRWKAYSVTTIKIEELQIIYLCLALSFFEQGKIFVVP